MLIYKKVRYLRVSCNKTYITTLCTISVLSHAALENWHKPKGVKDIKCQVVTSSNIGHIRIQHG